ncbi:MAG TPA: hypothetical protein VLJ21_04770, partial [Candidatus Binatia bacterium]|nr:hypothetical protein [Candidatus Binatia bacterium]
MAKRLRLRVVFYILALLLLAASAFAFEFNVEIDPDQASTRIGEAANYTLLISHDSGTSETFDIYSPDVEWDITTDIPRPITVQRGEVKQVTLFVKPLYASPGYYAFALHIRHPSTGDFIRKTLIIGVQPKNYVPGQYAPAVRIKTNVASSVDPRQPVVVTLNVTNANRRDLSNVQFKVRSNLVNAEAVLDLQGLEKKQLVFPVKIPANTPPQKDTIQVTALVQDGDEVIPFTAEPVEYDVMEYGEIAHTVSEESAFLKRTWTYTLVNNGNAPKHTEFQLRSKFFQGWFTTTEPLAKSVKLADGVYDAWDISLGVGETTEVKVITNYRPLLVVFIVLALAIAAYYTFRSPLVVRKSAVVIAAREGGMSELKVLIEVANRSSKPVKDVRVLDKVPHIAEVVRDFEVGTLRPTKIVHDDKKRTLMKWTLDELDSDE